MKKQKREYIKHFRFFVILVYMKITVMDNVGLLEIKK